MGEKERRHRIASKDTIALFISAICALGVLHLEWNVLNCEWRLCFQRKDDWNSKTGDSVEHGLSRDDLVSSSRIKRTPYTIQNVRQLVREEIHEILEGEFCTSKKQLCIKGSRGENGRQGIPGSPGKPGFKGEKGARGERGIQGIMGKGGPQGPPGRNGERGYPGSVGFPGVKGEKGATGDKGNPISAPVITSPPVSLVVNETEKAVLHCDVKANPKAKVTWSKVNSSLPIGRYTQSSDNRLFIRNVQLKDDGTFVCTASNVLGTVKVLSRIHVQVKPEFFIKPKKSITEVGKTVTLACGASGRPAPRIWWTKLQMDVPARRLFSLQYGHLTIVNVSKQDQGIYRCHAENVLGKIFTSVQLTVLTRLEFIISPPAAVMAVLGEKLEIHCAAKADFRPLVTWAIEGQLFMPSGIMIYPNGTLMISKVSRAHQGSYKCMATSQITTIQTTLNVTVKYPESCSIIKKFVTRISGSYIIDPDGVGGVDPFVVYCNMTERDKIGVTVVSHDSEDRILVDGCDPKGCYSRQVLYTGASLKQLTSLTKVSAKCEQFIRYDCYNTWFLSEGYAWWISRDSVKMTHWGGAPVGSGKCACGVTNSCYGGWKCNCDYLERRWKEDSGFLTDKSILPVIELRFGDTGVSSEQGFHTLGKFKCYGIA